MRKAKEKEQNERERQKSKTKSKTKMKKIQVLSLIMAAFCIFAYSIDIDSDNCWSDHNDDKLSVENSIDVSNISGTFCMEEHIPSSNNPGFAVAIEYPPKQTV